jgi:hypothetical protein
MVYKFVLNQVVFKTVTMTNAFVQVIYCQKYSEMRFLKR